VSPSREHQPKCSSFLTDASLSSVSVPCCSPTPPSPPTTPTLNPHWCPFSPNVCHHGAIASVSFFLIVTPKWVPLNAATSQTPCPTSPCRRSPDPMPLLLAAHERHGPSALPYFVWSSQAQPAIGPARCSLVGTVGHFNFQ
jgi:hypothetical protein